VTLVAITKSVSPRVAEIAASLGLHDLGEGRPQELWKKATFVTGVNWHLVGHLQRNKIDRTAPLVKLIHSVDSERLLEALGGFGRTSGSEIPVLLEVNCSGEESKGGFSPEAVPALGSRVGALTGVSVRGLMTMAAHAKDSERARPAFAKLRGLRDALRAETGLPLNDLSMGMSNDYTIGVEEGATLVRIGTTLFEGLEGAPTG
jgi:pyridoxal phosphate enzyme (YggS family)